MSGTGAELTGRWPLPEAGELRDELLGAWSESHRRYHDLTHLHEVLERLDVLLDDRHDALAVILAAWFHDAVYDGDRDDEERSALLAEDRLPGLVRARTVAEVSRLVRLTATHRPEDDDVNGQALSDADLAILAADPERYLEYAAAVRVEFGDLDDSTFAAGRAAVLRDLLAKDALFHSERARGLWELAARKNVGAELTALAQTAG